MCFVNITNFNGGNNQVTLQQGKNINSKKWRRERILLEGGLQPSRLTDDNKDYNFWYEFFQ